MLDSKSFLQNLTHHPGVYQLLGKDSVVLYVGKARDLKKRLATYFSNKQQDTKTAALMKHVVDVDITVTNNETEALILECNLIKKHRPHYNVLYRDDKSYPYILITTDQKFPQIEFYRGSRRKKGKFFGPFPSAGAVRETIKLIQKLFNLRTCSDSFMSGRLRPCLQHQIGQCTGPCVGLISEEEYRQNVDHAILFLEGKNSEVIDAMNLKMEHAAKQLNFELAAHLRDQMMRLREIQAKQYVSSDHGDVDVIGSSTVAGIVCVQLLIIRGGRILGSRAHFPSVPAHSTEEEILSSFITQHYLNLKLGARDIPKEIILGAALNEQTDLQNLLTAQANHKVIISANVRGERKKWLEIANNSAQQSVTSHLIGKTNIHARFKALQAVLNLEKPINLIECFDISHTMGEATVGSCVVFDQDGPIKSAYRRFNIKDITPGDDVAATKQVLTRRYKKLADGHARLPDIILIDGGVTQSNIARLILDEYGLKDILIIGVAKGITRKPGFETLYLANDQTLNLSGDSPALHLIQQIRDEAHRFAITGHRARRDKTRRTSTLEAIPGIGAKRRRELLRYFGGIQAINRASLEEISKVPGISIDLAQRIFTMLHT